MVRKALYLLPLVVVVAAGFALGHLRQNVKTQAARRILYYQDPMHPAYKSDKPGKAPDCGMDLVPVYAQDVAKALPSDQPATGGDVLIDPTTQQIYGIRLAKVEKNSGQGTIRVFGRVEPDDTRVYRVNFGAEGFVKETHDDAVGDYVKKNQRIAVVYSPEFLSVAGGFLAANEHSPMTNFSSKENVAAFATQGAASVQARADRLRNLGMSEMQIEEISKNHMIPEDIYVVSPTDGFILSRNISPGMRFDRESELYRIADLSHVWIAAEVFGKDAAAFRAGTIARVTLPDTGETLQARVSDVLPEVDPATRTLRPRLLADNPGFKLRPNMFVNVEVPVSLPPGLTVPVDAILDSGLTKRVFVQTSQGHFEPRTVETGWKLNDRVQIVKGLHEGETVVSSGTFLVDSESRLQIASASGGSMRNAPHTVSPQGSRAN
jgi:RND family efflux transporter MFP subunit